MKSSLLLCRSSLMGHRRHISLLTSRIPKLLISQGLLLGGETGSSGMSHTLQPLGAFQTKF
jgi:hypothetical protein